MDMRLISIMLAFGTVALLSGGAPSLAVPSQAKYTRDECIKIVIDLFDKIPIDADVMARVNEARQFYNNDINPAHTTLPGTESCRSFVIKMASVAASIPAPCEHVMGTDRYQTFLDILKRSKAARLRLEASFACQTKRISGTVMRALGVFDAITEQD